MTRKLTRRISSRKKLQMLALERHSRRCIICHHPEREAIEEEFVHWRAPWKIADEYKVADSRTIYRHARATGILFERRESLHSALDAIVENAEDVTVTGDCILRAMRAYSCIDRRGRWTELPTHLNIATFQAARPIQEPAHVIDIEDADDDTDRAAIEPKFSNRASRSDATACAASSAQAVDELEDDDDPDDDPNDDPESIKPKADESETNEPNYSNQASLRDATTRAVSSARASAVSKDQSGRSSTATACAVTPARSSANYSNIATRSDDTARAAHSNPASRSDHPTCAAIRVQCSAAVEPKLSNRRSRSEPTACAASPAQPSGAAERSDASGTSQLQRRLKKSRQRKSTTSAASPAEPFAAAKRRDRMGRPRLQPPHKKNRKRKSTACAVSPAQALAVAVQGRSLARHNNSTGRTATATNCAASSAQPAAASKRSGAIHRSRLQPQPKKASRRKSTASDSFWTQTLDELTRKLAAAKAEARRSATPVAPSTQTGGESTMSGSPSPGDGTASAGLPSDTEGLPAQLAPDVSESAGTPPVTAAPAAPRTNPYATPPAQAFPVQLRHPGPYGM